MNGIEEIKRSMRDKPPEKFLIWEIALCEIALQLVEMNVTLGVIRESLYRLERRP